MIDVSELRERIDGMYAEPFSGEAQEVIHDGRSHVSEIWQDGEITATKAGDLYQNRRIHGSEPPFIPEGQVLFSIEDLDHNFGKYDDLKFRRENKRMVIIDEELREIVSEYREFAVKRRVIEQFEECENCRFGLVHKKTGICSDCNVDIHD